MLICQLCGKGITSARTCADCAAKLAAQLWPRGADLPLHSGSVPEEHYGSTCSAACSYCGRCS